MTVSSASIRVFPSSMCGSGVIIQAPGASPSRGPLNPAAGGKAAER